MIHTPSQRAHTHHRTRSPPLISRPSAASGKDTYTPMSPPTSPPRGRRPSVSGAMTWLTRTASNAPYTPSKPIRISEPQFNLSLESLTISRSGVLGRGATVVRTPQEALAGTSASYVDVATGSFKAASHTADASENYLDEHETAEDGTAEGEPDMDLSDNRTSQTSSLITYAPARPSRAPPAVPTAVPSQEVIGESSTPRSSPKSVSPARSILESFPPVPPLPDILHAQQPVPPFDPILMSPPPGAIHMKDAAKVIVILETSTMTHRTTLKTLISRPSRLATYLKTLIPSNPRDSDTESIYSHVSDIDMTFNSIFHNHLNSGSLSQASTMHIFLDRPSEPYASVLAYLRSPIATAEHPVVLPRAAQLNCSSSSRVEALLDLRDEARFLGLEELEKLCNDEVRRRQSMTSSLGLGLHMRGFSNASGHSARSLRTLQDHDERPALLAKEAAQAKPALRNDFVSTGLQQRTPPRDRSRTRLEGSATMRSRPIGDWI